MIDTICITEGPILRAAKERVPEMSLRVEAIRAPIPADSDDRLRLLVWAEGQEYEAFERAVEADPTVTESRVLTDAGHRRLYRLIYTERGMESSFYPAYVGVDAILRTAVSWDAGWKLRLLFPDRQGLTAVKQWFDSRGLKFELEEVSTWDGTEDQNVPTLSRAQAEAVQTAIELGHFEVPRRATRKEVAHHLGISDTAFSQRIRRAHSTVYRYLINTLELEPTPRADVID